MKRCPTCDKTFADGMKFCQTDGTVLIADTPAADPYKTVVGNQSDMPAPPVDPFKTMVAGSAKIDDDDDLLQLPDEPDAMKTMVVSQDEINRELKADKTGDAPPLDLPPAPSAPLIEPQKGSSSDATAIINSSELPNDAPQKFDSKPFQNDFSSQSPYGNTDNLPIPSPFQDSMPPGGYQPPPISPFNEPKSPVKESEPMYQEPREPVSQSPFAQSPSTPFGNADPFNQPMGQAEWTPPPAPVAGWQDQGLGANTPFQPPVAAIGQDKTLAIVSLVCGILSIVCCGAIAGIPAIITGYMAKNNVDSNPNQYTGRGMALAGMILGGVSLVFSALYIIYVLLVGFSTRF